MEPDCPFCAIAAGEREANRIYADDRTVAFLDDNPATAGHTLVIPTDHREEVVTDEAAPAVFETVDRVASAIDEALEPDGFSVFHTSGSLVGRITHAHVHVVPRYEGDGVGFGLERTRLDPAEGEELAEQIVSNL